jgi:hypothetical protein
MKAGVIQLSPASVGVNVYYLAFYRTRTTNPLANERPLPVAAAAYDALL